MKTVKKAVYVAAVGAMLAVSAQISIPLPFLVPLTLQLPVMIAAAMILGPNLGALSAVAYLFMGLAGLPVFANFGGGPEYIFKPSFGFLLGFVPASYIAGLASQSVSLQKYPKNENQKNGFRQMPSSVLSLLMALLALYALGLTYQYLILRYYLAYSTESALAAVKAAFTVFFLADLLKLLPLCYARSTLTVLRKKVAFGFDFYN